MTSRERLGHFEAVVLMALVRLGDNAYGVSVRHEILDRTGREVSVGALYTTLDRLERKGFISSFIGAPTSERGGRAKKFFRIQAPGQRALNEAQLALARMGEGLAHA